MFLTALFTKPGNDSPSFGEGGFRPLSTLASWVRPAKQESPNESATEPLTIDISGKITDADGSPLMGANIKVKGTTNGTTTNADGSFILKGVDENATLEISYVGFVSQNIEVKNQSNI